MSRQNCWCGRIRTANCISCGTAVCQDHINSFPKKIFNSVHYDRVTTQSTHRVHGYGKTLADAAHHQGYWQAPRESYTCPSCRDATGAVRQSEVLRSARGWASKGSLGVAINAARRGLVYEEVGLSYSQIIQTWLSWGQPCETIGITEVTSPARSRRKLGGGHKYTPEKTKTQWYVGWNFPATVYVEVEMTGRYAGLTEWQWAGVTKLGANGDLWQRDRLMPIPHQGDVPHLVVAMAKKLCEMRGGEWLGPASVWSWSL